MDQKQRKQSLRSSKFLPKGVSLVHFQAHQHPFSPARDPQRRHAEPKQRGFSGPMFEPTRSDQPEPISPKVSCIGLIKHKKGAVETKSSVSPANTTKKAKSKKGSHSFLRIFSRSRSDITEAASAERRKPIDKPPLVLGEMKKFSSGRRTLVDYDLRINEETDSDEEFSNTNSIGTGVGALEFKPREEVNLWKRRTIAPPIPLLLR